MPRTIKQYLETETDEKALVMQFNRHGNLLAAAMTSGRIFVWDFDTKSIATIIRAYPIDIEPLQNSTISTNRKRAKVISLTFLAPGNGSAIVIAYDCGLIRVFHTLSTRMLCQLWITGITSLHQVEAHPKIDSLLIAVPSDSLPILLHLRRGSYQLAVKQLQRITDPSILVPAPSAPISSKQKDPDVEIIDPACQDGIDEDDFDCLSSSPPAPQKTSFGNTHISSLPPGSSALTASLLCASDEFHRHRQLRHRHKSQSKSAPSSKSQQSRRRPRPPTDNSKQQQNKNAASAETISSDSDEDYNQSNSDSDSHSEQIAQPIELITNLSGGNSLGNSAAEKNNYAGGTSGNGIMNGLNGGANVNSNASLGLNGSGQKKRPSFCIAFSRHPRRILRAGPTGLLRIFGLQRAPDTHPFVHTAVSLYTIALQSRVPARSLTVSRRDKLLVNSYDRCLRLYDLRALDLAAGSPSPAQPTPCSTGSEKPSKQSSTSENADDDVVMVDDGDLDKNGMNSSKALQIQANPEATFSEIVNRAQCRSAVFSLDGDFVVGGVDGPQHRIHIWRVQDGQIDVTLEGPKEGVVQLLIHPLRPVIVSLGAIRGGIYIWDKEITENWSAFSTQFSELEANEEYMEREDEFDLVDEENETLVQRRYLEEAADVDITGPFRPGWFDSDSEPESFFYLPAIPEPDTHNGVPLLVDSIIAQRREQLSSLKRKAEHSGDGNKSKGLNGKIREKGKAKHKARNERSEHDERKSEESGGGRRSQDGVDQEDTGSQDDESGSNDHESDSDSGNGEDSNSESESDSSSGSEDSDNASASPNQSEITVDGENSRFHQANTHTGGKGPPINAPPFKRARPAPSTSTKDRDVASASSAIVVLDDKDTSESIRPADRRNKSSKAKAKPKQKTANQKSKPKTKSKTGNRNQQQNSVDGMDSDSIAVIEEEQVLDEEKG